MVPIVNVDGFTSSRGALDPADTSGDPADVLNLVEAVAPPGGSFAYRRKNCDGEIAGPDSLPCELAWGVDNNRNYGNLWGGPGSSSDVTSQSYHGPGPRSEPETQAVWNFARTHQVTFLMTLHTVAALVLRPPGLHDAGLAPDEARMKELGDAMGKAAGYTSQYSLPALRHGGHDRGRHLRGDRRLRLHDRDGARPAASSTSPTRPAS